MAEYDHTHVTYDEAHDADDPTVGEGTPDTAPQREVPVPLVQAQPVLVLLLVAVLTELGGSITLLALDHTTAGILVAAGALITGVGGHLARSLVTPIARPRDNHGNTLTPD